jgi:hypothetical protein
MAQLVTLLTCIRELPRSNLDRDITYPDFLWRFSFPPVQCCDSTLKNPLPLPSTSFLIHYSLIAHSFEGLYSEYSKFDMPITVAARSKA